eukprot:COSAG04_NODE_16_length_40397_cov_59.653677_19_plen_233_part_00
MDAAAAAAPAGAAGAAGCIVCGQPCAPPPAERLGSGWAEEGSSAKAVLGRVCADLGLGRPEYHHRALPGHAAGWSCTLAVREAHAATDGPCRLQVEQQHGSTKKRAEQAAALEWLLHYQREVGDLPPPVAAKKRRKLGGRSILATQPGQNRPYAQASMPAREPSRDAEPRVNDKRQRRHWRQYQVIPTPLYVLGRISPRNFSVFSRFLRVFTVSPRRFQRAASRSPGPRNSS